MAGFDYKNLLTEYNKFVSPKAAVLVGGKNLSEDAAGFSISDVEIEMSAGYESGMATFWIYDCFDNILGSFKTEQLAPYIHLGSQVTICLGYDLTVRNVFCGFIARVNFDFSGIGMPGVEVTVMDARGIMMANNHSQQLKAVYFSDAVEEIFRQQVYMNLRQKKIITGITVDATPDKPVAGGNVGTAPEKKASDKTVEMVSESDYEFVVKAAKKFNYDFFVYGGEVIFRKAKSNKDILIELTPQTGVHTFNLGYDITGLTSEIEVRCLDVGKGKMISASRKNTGKISNGNQAKALLSKSKKVYIDPTTASKMDAENRLDFLMEDMIYRFATLEMETVGLPEIVPGRFIKAAGFGENLNRIFYVQTVKHVFTESGYVTKITAKACSLED